jgi:hypothetical protein
LADRLADPRPWATRQVQEADTAVPEIVRREGRDTCRSAGAGDGCSEAVAAEVLEDTPLRDAIVARAQIEHRLEHRRRHLHPPGPTRLRDSLRHAPP